MSSKWFKSHHLLFFRFGFVILGATCIILIIYNIDLDSDRSFAYASESITVACIFDITSDVENHSLNHLAYVMQAELEVLLSKFTSISVLERSSIDSVLQEFELQSYDLIEPHQVLRLGKLVEPQFIIVGQIEKKQEDLSVTATLVDIQSAEISVIEATQKKVFEDNQFRNDAETYRFLTESAVDIVQGTTEKLGVTYNRLDILFHKSRSSISSLIIQVGVILLLISVFVYNNILIIMAFVFFLVFTGGLVVLVIAIKRKQEFQEEFNPYQPGEPIIDPKDFYGRTVELGQIRFMLQSGSVIVYGERRIGKTSILRQIERTIDDKFIPCFVQLGDATPETFFRKIGRGIATGCNKVGILIDDLLVNQQGEGYDSLDLRDDIKRVIDRINEAGQGEKLLIIVDEVDVTNKFPGYMQGAIRAIAQDFTQSLKFLVAGTYIEEAEDDSSARPSAWYNSFRHLKIEPLGEAEAYQLIEKPVGRAYRYTSEAVDYIHAQSLGRPYIIQLICYHMVECMRVRHKTRIRLEDAEIAFAEATKELEPRLKNLWVHIPEPIKKGFKTQGYLEYTADSQWIEGLEKEGIVWHGKGNIRPSPIFAEWLRRTQI